MSRTKNIRTFELSKHLSRHISCRAAVLNLFNLQFDKADVLILDFEEIEFVSRAAAHQFLLERKRLKQEFDISMEYKNVNSIILELFEIVEKSSNSKRSVKEIKSLEFSSTSDLSKFLLTV